MESGLFKFYSSFVEFKEKFSQQMLMNHDDDDFKALTMQQLKRPTIFFLTLCGFAIIIFILEIIISSWENRRGENRRH